MISGLYQIQNLDFELKVSFLSDSSKKNFENYTNLKDSTLIR